MRILALDASSTMIGWVLWNGQTAITHGSTKLGKSGTPQWERLICASHLLVWLIQKTEPEHIAVETAAQQAKGAYGKLVQAETRGVLRLVAGKYNIPFLDINLSTAKKALTDNGRADKDQMIAAARKYLAGSYDEHAADAMAVALVAEAELKLAAAVADAEIWANALQC